MVKLVILDRDGVINQDSKHYIKSAQEWVALPGSIEAIVKLQQHGYQVAIATNQSGIAKKLFSLDELDLMHKKMIDLVVTAGGAFDFNNIFVCPHNDNDNCDCRKPKPGLLLQATKKFGVKTSEALLVGDAMRDILAARACDMKAILVRTGKGEDTLKQNNIEEPVCADLASVADLVIEGMWN